jgi:hypothetical protein
VRLYRSLEPECIPAEGHCGITVLKRVAHIVVTLETQKSGVIVAALINRFGNHPGARAELDNRLHIAPVDTGNH